MTWVFFRAADLDRALAYLGSMFALREARAGAALLAGIVYQPYYLLSLALAAGIAWTAPQAWDWTKQLSWVKAGACLGLLALALVAMATQGYNPFIYFIF